MKLLRKTVLFLLLGVAGCATSHQEASLWNPDEKSEFLHSLKLSSKSKAAKVKIMADIPENLSQSDLTAIRDLIGRVPVLVTYKVRHFGWRDSNLEATVDYLVLFFQKQEEQWRITRYMMTSH